ncbi:MAG: hypothetical protein M3112_08240 [Actinomycetia bacterium]|nr:hypothetical protein [Actinomycetes bacterium]
MPERDPRPWRTSARRGSLSMVLWAFGLATTLLLVGLWGRAVTHDQATVQESARSVVNAEIASDRIYSWIEEGVGSATEVDSVTTQRVISGLRDHPEVERAVDALVGQFIGALFSADGGETTVELTDTLAPVVPLLVLGFAAFDVSVDEAVVSAALVEAESIDLETGDIATVARVVDSARALLSLIVVLSAVILVVTGSTAVWLSEDSLAMIRTLATRIVLSALSFAVLFRVASWALDPDGGGSPIARGGSILLGSNSDIFFAAAFAGAAVASGVGWVAWRRRRRGGDSLPSSEQDTDTRELVLS